MSGMESTIALLREENSQLKQTVESMTAESKQRQVTIGSLMPWGGSIGKRRYSGFGMTLYAIGCFGMTVIQVREDLTKGPLDRWTLRWPE